MKIAIVADTHMPRGGRRLPDACVARLRSSELILHAGDLITRGVLEELGAYGELAAVHGNVDDGELRACLPAERRIEVGDVTIAMVHDAGTRSGRLRRLRARFPDADAVIFGHSHLPLHERSDDGAFQIFNPGSPTERRRAPRHTMGVARVREARIDFELLD
jgi:putative phosphoesterase